jgi:hypothetical protein
MGVALVSSLKQQGITDTVVPASSLVIFLLIAALLGLIAASWPAPPPDWTYLTPSRPSYAHTGAARTGRRTCTTVRSENISLFSRSV